MSEGTLLNWAVSVGDEVAEGETVAEVSTDKVDFDVPAPVAGRVLELPWQAGDVIPVGEVLMVFDVPSSGSGAQPAATGTPPAPERSGTPDSGPQPVVASPVVRRIAAEQGIDLRQIKGSGPGGRILEEDLETAGPAPLQDSAEPGDGARVVRLTGVRAIAARRMAESTRTAATSTTTFRVRADRILAVVDQATSDGLRLSPFPVIIRSVAEALTRHPRFNATVEPDGESLKMYRTVNLSVAVATDEGLMVPVIRDVGSFGFMEIAEALRDLKERARVGRLTPADVRGGSFTVSSTGGLERADILSTVPIINPPQTATLWVSRISECASVIDGAVRPVPTLTASISFDHRFIDGADAVAFINDLSETIEGRDAPI